MSKNLIIISRMYLFMSFQQNNDGEINISNKVNSDKNNYENFIQESLPCDLKSLDEKERELLDSFSSCLLIYPSNEILILIEQLIDPRMGWI